MAKRWYQYEVIDLRLNCKTGDLIDVEATSERSARRKAAKEWPEDSFRLHLIGSGEASEAATEADDHE